jgi:hypothetical protein
VSKTLERFGTKWTDAEIAQVREQCAAGVSDKDIAASLGRTETGIEGIRGVHKIQRPRCIGYENSNAGKVRAALVKLGWDAPADQVANEVGKVRHHFDGGYWDETEGQWKHRERIGLLPTHYINTVRNKWRDRLSPTPAAPRRA